MTRAGSWGIPPESVPALPDIAELVTASAWAYAIVVGFVALDGFFPVVPGETVIIAAAVLAVQGELSLALVAAAGALGSLIGDTTSYTLGRRLGSRAARRLHRGGRAQGLLDWAQRRLEEHGVSTILVARFVPGGRTATTFAAGTVRLAWRRFLAADAVASVVWAAYATALGVLGGEAFADSTWLSLGLSLGIAGTLAAGAELVRRARMDGGGHSGAPSTWTNSRP